MTDTERYLRHATRGLWGRQRQALRAELAGHITQRVQEFQIAGLSRAEAERQTLRELGAPAQVAAGMAEVHSLPALTRTGLGLALAATLMLGAIQPGLAQVRVFDKNSAYFPVVSPYLDVGSLVREARRAGLAGLVARDGSLAVGPFRWKTTSSGSAVRPNPNYGVDPFIQRGQQLFVRSDILLDTFASFKHPVTLSGLYNPALQIGGKTMQLGTAAQPYDARPYLMYRVYRELGLNGYSTWTDDPAMGTIHRFVGEPGAVYALAVRDSRPDLMAGKMSSIQFLNDVYVKIVQADAQGQLRVVLPMDRLGFGQTDPKRLALVTVPAGSTAPAVLMRLNLRLDRAGGPLYTVVPATQVKELR